MRIHLLAPSLLVLVGCSSAAGHRHLVKYIEIADREARKVLDEAKVEVVGGR